MTPSSPLSRRRFLAASALAGSSVPVLGGTAAAGRPPRPSGDPLPALRAAARPLRSTEPAGPLDDLRPLGRAVGGALVVGLGEATHGSHEFFAMKHRVFRYLVEHRGFRTFALEDAWSTGLLIDDYVLHGKGDPRTIMKEELRGKTPWETREFLDLFRWMRAHNLRSPRKVRFMGDDMNVPTLGKELTGKVIGYVRGRRPALVPEFERLYARLLSLADSDALLALPLERRREIDRLTTRAYDLLATLRPAPGAGREAFEWALQHARSIVQTTRLHSFDYTTPEGARAGMLFRDGAMAENVRWWRLRTGHKILLSAHNGHVGYVPDDPGSYPKTQGAFLREHFGARYTNIGFTFYQGSFQARTDDGPDLKRITVGPPEPGGNEATLDRAGPARYFLDMRTAPAPARAWLAQKRPTRNIGTGWPEEPYDIALGPAYDNLIHLHSVEAAVLL
ncbi:erythromycin esterase family protein [Actinomadura rubrisoli]|uniref:Erythromycin esterase family protein n=1 Tax=Actinomadura rubrisoli TaxID=2530368 RepID=A0A4R5AJV4_9ACTN|nr:erythromycin esterase family protein [Actinomadura rubrisoli]TDD72913.1 erythromycin esterase family protein [Actinomadura rubrisoli]